MSLEPGQIVDRYQVEAFIGEGGMASVYRVRHTKLHTAHALKVLSWNSPAIADRMLQEGRVQASLQHPNVVSVTDIVDVDNQPGLVMEYIDGPTLEQRILQRPLLLSEADGLARGVIAGVAAAHAIGWIHRDLKPANILLAQTPTGVVPKITDFGLAKILDEQKGGSNRTRTGSTMGTPQYMPPEQIRDAKSVDQRADIYAIGAILYEMVTGRRVFPGDDVLTIFKAVAENDFISPIELVPGLPRRMERTILRALQMNALDRFPDCQELLASWTGTVSPVAIRQHATPVPTSDARTLWPGAGEAAPTLLRQPSKLSTQATVPPAETRGGAARPSIPSTDPSGTTTAGASPAYAVRQPPVVPAIMAEPVSVGGTAPAPRIALPEVAAARASPPPSGPASELDFLFGGGSASRRPPPTPEPDDDLDLEPRSRRWPLALLLFGVVMLGLVAALSFSPVAYWVGEARPDVLVEGSISERQTELKRISTDPDATDVIVAVVHKDPELQLRRQAFEVVESRWRNHVGEVGAFSALAVYLIQSERDPELLRGAWDALEQHSRQPSALVPLLSHPDPGVRLRAIKVLDTVGKRVDQERSVMFWLEQRLGQESDPDVHAMMARLIYSIKNERRVREGVKVKGELRSRAKKKGG